jgi:hypothetical protein
MNDTF